MNFTFAENAEKTLEVSALQEKLMKLKAENSALKKKEAILNDGLAILAEDADKKVTNYSKEAVSQWGSALENRMEAVKARYEEAIKREDVSSQARLQTEMANISMDMSKAKHMIPEEDEYSLYRDSAKALKQKAHTMSSQGFSENPEHGSWVESNQWYDESSAFYRPELKKKADELGGKIIDEWALKGKYINTSQERRNFYNALTFALQQEDSASRGMQPNLPAGRMGGEMRGGTWRDYYNDNLLTEEEKSFAEAFAIRGKNGKLLSPEKRRELYLKAKMNPKPHGDSKVIGRKLY